MERVKIMIMYKAWVGVKYKSLKTILSLLHACKRYCRNCRRSLMRCQSHVVMCPIASAMYLASHCGDFHDFLCAQNQGFYPLYFTSLQLATVFTWKTGCMWSRTLTLHACGCKTVAEGAMKELAQPLVQVYKMYFFSWANSENVHLLLQWVFHSAVSLNAGCNFILALFQFL